MALRKAIGNISRWAVQARHSSTMLAVGQRKTNAFTIVDPSQLQLTSEVPLRGRKFLPGADASSFPKYLNGPKENFPLALEAVGSYSIEDWGKLCREEADANLLSYGAILFRGLPVDSANDFNRLFHNVGYPAMNYIGGSAHREHVSSQVYSASDEPPECCIDLHNEMSYCPVYNKKVSFVLSKFFIFYHCFDS